MIPKGIKAGIIRMLNSKIPVAACAGLVVFSFLLGIVVNDYYREKIHNTFQAGYQARDVEAYRNLIQRPNIRWRIIRSYTEPHYGKTAYTLETRSGQIVDNFIPCEDMGWYNGQVLTDASYYLHGDCMSFQGPAAHWTIEPYEQAKGQ